MRQVFLRRVIDIETASVLYHRDDLAGHLGRNSGAAESRTHDTILTQDTLADISGTMYNDSTAGGVVIKSLVHTFDTERHAIDTGVGPLRDIETKAALAGLHFIRKRIGKLLTGINTVRNIGTIQDLAVADVYDIQALIAGRLTEVTDRQNAGFTQKTLFP